MSKLTGRSKKDIFYPSTGLEKDRNNKPVKKLEGENTSEIKKDRSGKDYSLVQETTENFIKGDTIRPGNLPRVNDFIQGGDYKVKETPESKKRATDEPRTFSPVRLENDYSSMKSMGQAVARWTSPLGKKDESYGVLKPDWHRGKVDAQGNYERIEKETGRYDYSPNPFVKNPEYLSKPQPGSDPRAAANTKLGIEKPIPKYIKRPEEEPKKKTKAPAKPKFKPLEKVEKRGEGINSMGEATYKTDVNLPQFSDPVTLSTSKITTKEEADKSRERRDNERMQKAVDTANASETLLKGKEKRKLAQYDRQAKRGSEESKLKRRTAASKGVQALGSLLKDVGKPDSDIKPVKLASEKASTEKPEDDKKTTTGQRKFDITNLSF